MSSHLLIGCGKSSGVSRPVLKFLELPNYPLGEKPAQRLRSYADPSRGFLLRWLVDSDYREPTKRFWTDETPEPSDAELRPGTDHLVHRFDPATGAFVPSSLAEWRELGTELAARGLPTIGSRNRANAITVRPEYRNRWAFAGGPEQDSWGTLYHDRREIPLPEPYLVSKKLSPDGAYLLVLMQNGRFVKSMWGNGTLPTGPTHAVIYSTESGRQVSDVYRLGTARGDWGAMWTSDNRYVLMPYAYDTEAISSPAARYFVLPNPDLVDVKPKLR